MVGADAAVKAAVMVGAQDLDDAGLAAAVTVGSLREVTVLEVVDVAYDYNSSHPLPPTKNHFPS